MKILFINGSCSGARYFPTGVALLLTLLKKENHDVCFFDTNFYELTDMPQFYPHYVSQAQKIGIHKRVVGDGEYTEKITYDKLLIKLEEIKSPDLIVFSSFSDSYPLTRRIAQDLKVGRDVKKVIGGVHCKVAAREVAEEGIFDYIFEHDAEKTLPLLCRVLSGSANISLDDIDGLYYKTEGGRFAYNPLKSQPDIELLPTLDLSFFDSRYFSRPYDGQLKRVLNYESSRGCPYKCTYCINSMLHKNSLMRKLRLKSIDKVINELKYLTQEYKFEMIVFMDETFLCRTMDELETFAACYNREIQLPFTISTRAETVSEEKVRLLKDMNCASVSIGVECGNEQLRRNILKRNMSNQVLLNAFELFNKYEIRNSSLNIIGIPEETEKDIKATIQFNRELSPTTISVAILYPYHGTEIREYCINKGYFNPDWYKPEINPIVKTVLKLPTLSEEIISDYYYSFVSRCRT